MTYLLAFIAGWFCRSVLSFIRHLRGQRAIAQQPRCEICGAPSYGQLQPMLDGERIGRPTWLCIECTREEVRDCMERYSGGEE